MQRVDVHPLDEAAGYAALIELQPDTYTVESISSRVGRSPAYVNGRLRLIQLIPEAKQAFYEDKLTVAHAFEIARLQPNDQRRALQGCFPQYRNAAAILKDKKAEATTVRERCAWIEREIHLDLTNAPEGLTIGELGEWLGHKDLRSTQHYAKIQPTRLAKSIARANKNSRLVQVIVDPAAAAKGEPAIFYYLGDGAYCANPAWASCPHRMACLKCPMYVAKKPAQLIEARDGILRLMQEVPLTDEEKSVAEGDVKALNRYIENRKHVPPPPVQSELYIFNS